MYARLFVTANIPLMLSVYTTTIQASESEIIDTAVREARQVAMEGPFLPRWESLEKYEIPAWYKDAKFGIFIHWGVYSVPAYMSEWYPRMMYIDQDTWRGHGSSTAKVPPARRPGIFQRTRTRPLRPRTFALLPGVTSCTRLSWTGRKGTSW